GGCGQPCAAGGRRRRRGCLRRRQRAPSESVRRATLALHLVGLRGAVPLTRRRQRQPNPESQWRREEEEQEESVLAARPALIFCRVVDALQSALKSGGGGNAAAAVAAAAGGGQGTLEVFLSGGDDLLLAASSAAHEAIKPLSKNGGVVAILAAMGLKEDFASAVVGGEREAGAMGEREKAEACRARVLNLLCEGEVFALAGSRS
ncbi:unnamed protein product, partial [Ectocarpus sp. 6 AP-2014]